MKTSATLHPSLALVDTTAEATNLPVFVSALQRAAHRAAQRAAQRATDWVAGRVQDPRDAFLAASVNAEDYERRLAAWEGEQLLRRALPLVR